MIDSGEPFREKVTLTLLDDLLILLYDLTSSLYGGGRQWDIIRMMLGIISPRIPQFNLAGKVSACKVASMRIR